MKRVLSAVAFLGAAAAGSLCADAIPYPNDGTIAPTHTYTATANGSIDAYFYGSSASDTDYINVVDTTQGISTGIIFDNKTTTPGSEVTLAGVSAGDNIEFYLYNETWGIFLWSVPTSSPDGINHAYGTSYSGGFDGIPAGTFIGMEDLAYNDPGASPQSDLDYNDDQFVFTNIAYVGEGSQVGSAPEPASVILIGTGLVLLGLLRKKVLSWHDAEKIPGSNFALLG